MQCDITVLTPMTPEGRQVSYEGDARIDGVPGRSAPITINFLDTAGSVCAGLLPTGQVRDRVRVEPPAGAGFDAFEIEVTCIDNGMPLVLFPAGDMGCTGRETPAELTADEALKARIEALRLLMRKLMGLGDVSARDYPKMTLVSGPSQGGAVSSRCFIPHGCHE